ncbi:septal ring lytic transglycosylase RlpA family protein [Stutzerimonas urumqiensis]|uniref:septal ring lytic transglycosylase RlpA family protein n=1 Tax=Stutzerimonas urumqiensis TaxID=638269 RepID=UPI000EAE4A12|nr:septal ring lytic transglycosylase RlpA family protein [Stutzerimonas urumqiensis]
MSRLACAGLALACAAALLAGCSSSRPPAVSQPSGGISGPDVYKRPSQDGAPWWDVDVSKIPDAVPMPHYGPVKANPYTVLGKTYYPINDATRYSEIGTASWYGTKFHGQATANGEEYDLYGMSAAHKTLPLPSYVKVTNLENGKAVVLRVNDRGPFYSDRVIDLSFAAAKKLGYAERGTARVKVEGIDPERWWANRGQSAPMVLAQPKKAVATATPASSGQVIEQYTPPPQQHAGAVVPVQIADAKAPPAGDGLFLQIGAFANPDAAQLLKDKLSGMVSTPVFVSSVVRDQQILHRVRLGPIASHDEASRIEESLRLADLGRPRLVRGD